jgi:hypothetical protein
MPVGEIESAADVAAKRLNQFVLVTLVVPLGVVVRHELRRRTPEMALAQQDQISRHSSLMDRTNHSA